MATYYDFFSTNTIRNEPIISIPYIDAFGTGKKQLKIVHPGRLQVLYHLDPPLKIAFSDWVKTVTIFNNYIMSSRFIFNI